MSIVLPFNYNPAATYQGNGASSTYTVATNHHAFIKVTLTSAIMHNSLFRDNSNLYSHGYGQSDIKTVTQEFILKDSDAVTFTVSAVDSDTNNTSITTLSDSLIVTMLINGNVAFRVKSKVTTTSSGPGTVDVRSVIYSDITWHAEEFLHA